MKKKGAKVNILLVDDHPENLLALQATLESPDYRLVEAKTGMEALKLLLMEEFDLILLDVFMPGLNGFETAAMIRERPKTRHIPIIFITAVNKTEADAAKGYALGAIDYIMKPFDPGILRTKVAALAELSYKGKNWRKQVKTVREEERESKALEISQLEKTSKERYKNLANAIPQIVWIASPDGKIDFFNQQWVSYTGLTFAESEGWGWKKVIHPDDLSLYLDQWKKMLEGAVPLETHCRLKREDGTYRWHLVRALAEKDDREVVAWLGTSTDIDDQKRAEEAVRQKRVEAEEATRIKSEFVSNVSHELRTPLNAILGYAALLIEETYGPVDENQKPPVVGIHRNALELLSLVNNLLDLSKIEAGKMPIVIEHVDLKSLLPEGFEVVRGVLMRGKNIAVRWKIPKELSVIESDGAKIRQIFLNLLSNAIKFTEKGSITIAAANIKDGVRFSIKDTGVGIKAQDLSYIFDPFRQVDGSMTRRVGGSGLGLTIVKNALKILRGEVEVESEFGKGSTFTVSLPLSPPIPAERADLIKASRVDGLD